MANGFDRRSFLKGAALTAAAIGTQFAQVMPARAEGDDQELADIYAYLLSIKPSPAAKDLPLPKF